MRFAARVSVTAVQNITADIIKTFRNISHTYSVQIRNEQSQRRKPVGHGSIVIHLECIQGPLSGLCATALTGLAPPPYSKTPDAVKSVALACPTCVRRVYDIASARNRADCCVPAW